MLGVLRSNLALSVLGRMRGILLGGLCVVDEVVGVFWYLAKGAVSLVDCTTHELSSLLQVLEVLMHLRICLDQRAKRCQSVITSGFLSCKRSCLRTAIGVIGWCCIVDVVLSTVSR